RPAPARTLHPPPRSPARAAAAASHRRRRRLCARQLPPVAARPARGRRWFWYGGWPRGGPGRQLHAPAGGGRMRRHADRGRRGRDCRDDARRSPSAHARTRLRPFRTDRRPRADRGHRRAPPPGGLKPPRARISAPAMEHELKTLTAPLLAQRWLPRGDKLVRRALVDETFRLELDRRLADVGLRLLDNPYAAHVGVALEAELAEPVFGAGREYAASNMGLTRDEIALLVIIWALIVLPKRERQVTRRELVDDGQTDLFGGADKPVAHGETVSGALTEASLIADFGPRLGGRTKVRNFMLGKLARLGFIERRNGLISEGPLLDLALDYRVMADRVIHGTLGEVL